MKLKGSTIGGTILCTAEANNFPKASFIGTKESSIFSFNWLFKSFFFSIIILSRVSKALWTVVLAFLLAVLAASQAGGINGVTIPDIIL